MPVKGFQRSIICDTQRNDFVFIPNSLYEILTNCKGLSIKEIYDFYKNEYNKEIDEYFQFLAKKEYGFFTKTPNLFPEIELNDKSYSLINNAIIDLDENSNYNIKEVFHFLDEIFCEAVQIRFFGSITIDFINGVVRMLESTAFTTVDVIISEGHFFKPFQIKLLLQEYPRITGIMLFNGKRENFFSENGRFVNYSIQKIQSANDCGCVSPKFFSTDLRHFIEAISFNTCLNKKISIDVNGEIKNCPSMDKGYGSFNRKKIFEVLKLKEFKKFWALNKDKIEVCKDCEFRYICPDCRVFIKDRKNIYSKPEKCNYDPYTAKWV